MGDGRGVVSAGDGTGGSGIVSSAADVLWMSVIRGMRGLVEYVCERRGWRGGSEWMGGLDFTNPVGTGGVLDVCLCFGCGGVGGEWVLNRVWRGGVIIS